MGLGLTTAAYVVFLDSDDWLPPDFLGRIAARLEREIIEPDIIFTQPLKYNMQTHRMFCWDDSVLVDGIFNDDIPWTNAMRNELLYDTAITPCRKVCRSSFLKRINYRFFEGTYWEDVFPHFLSLYHAERCIAVKETGFIYRVGRVGQTTSRIDLSRVQVVAVFARIYSYALQHDWNDVALRHILIAFYEFVRWSLDFSAVDVREKLLSSINAFYRAVPKHQFKAYLKHSSLSKKDQMLIKIMRSKRLYRLLEDPMFVRAVVRLISFGRR